MKRKTTKIAALTLSAALIVSTVGSAMYALDNKAGKREEKASSSAVSKDETVYAFADADGLVHKVIVSDWLQNTDKADTLSDASCLSDIENVKGEETFTAEDGDKLTWQANGEDIYYQGKTDKELPVQLSIHYTLDGKPISAEDLAGKSGKVTMRFDYNSTAFEDVSINGKTERIYVPFTMLTGMMLDTDVFRNVEVSSGKTENLGNTIAVVGLAFPHMQDNLNVSKDDIDIPDHVEVTADVKNFEMSTTMTLATTALLDDVDTDKLNLNKLSDAMDELTSGMDQLMDGSDQLYEGLVTLHEKSKELTAGVQKLSAGSTQLQAGANDLRGGAGQIKTGAKNLYNGLNKLDSKSNELNSGAEEVFHTLLSAANTQLKAAGLDVPTLTIGNYAGVLNGVINSMDSNAVYQKVLEQVTAEVNSHRGEIEQQVIAAVREQVANEVQAQVTAAVRESVTEKVREKESAIRSAVIAQALGMTVEEYESAISAGLVTQEQQDAVNAAVEAAVQAEVDKQMESDRIQATIAEKSKTITEEKMASDEIKALIAKNTDMQVEKAIADTMASDEIQAKLQQAAEGAQAVIALKASLDRYNGFYLGLKTYTAGVSSATAGANELLGGAETLQNGTDALYTGSKQLNSGIQEMKQQTPALLDGVEQLKNGSEKLSDGLKTMMEDGIQKLADVVDGDLDALTDRISACVDVAHHYNTFTGIAEHTDGTVKFLFKTDAIAVPEKEN